MTHPLETIALGVDDYDDEGKDRSSIEPNLQSHCLFMLLQSLPETQRALMHTTAFVNRAKYFKGEEPRTRTHDGKGSIITIDPVPTYSIATRTMLMAKACKEVDPKRYQEEEAKIAAAEQAVAESTARIQKKTEEVDVQIDTGGNREQWLKNLRDFKNKEYAKSRNGYGVAEHIRANRPSGYARDEVRKIEERFYEQWAFEQAKPITELLKSGGIEFRGGTLEQALIEIDQAQPDFDKKLSALMDTHRAKILEQFNSVKFIIPKPDGTALDADQATRAIAAHIGETKSYPPAIVALAVKYGVNIQVGHAISNGPADAPGGTPRLLEKFADNVTKALDELAAAIPKDEATGQARNPKQVAALLSPVQNRLNEMKGTLGIAGSEPQRYTGHAARLEARSNPGRDAVDGIDGSIRR